MLSISNIAKSFGDRTLFAGVSLQLNARERYGLVGANGSGKTTLLKILSGDLESTEGIVSIPKRVRLGVHVFHRIDLPGVKQTNAQGDDETDDEGEQFAAPHGLSISAEGATERRPTAS